MNLNLNLVVTELIVVVIREKHLVTATEVTFFKEKLYGGHISLHFCAHIQRDIDDIFGDYDIHNY